MHDTNQPPDFSHGYTRLYGYEHQSDTYPGGTPDVTPKVLTVTGPTPTPVEIPNRDVSTTHFCRNFNFNRTLMDTSVRPLPFRTLTHRLPINRNFTGRQHRFRYANNTTLRRLQVRGHSTTMNRNLHIYINVARLTVSRSRVPIQIVHQIIHRRRVHRTNGQLTRHTGIMINPSITISRRGHLIARRQRDTRGPTTNFRQFTFQQVLGTRTGAQAVTRVVFSLLTRPHIISRRFNRSTDNRNLRIVFSRQCTTNTRRQFKHNRNRQTRTLTFTHDRGRYLRTNAPTHELTDGASDSTDSKQQTVATSVWTGGHNASTE